MRRQVTAMVAALVVRSPEAAVRLFASLAHEAREVAAIAYLDAERRLLSLRRIRGRADGVEVPPRLIAADALALNAHSVLVAHNHPSGDATPSASDLAHTRTLARTLDALDVRLLDALILTPEGTVSFRELGLL